MNERPTLAILEQVDPPITRPFRLVETYISSDGYRSRICSGAWATRDEAEADRQRRIKVRGS